MAYGCMCMCTLYVYVYAYVYVYVYVYVSVQVDVDAKADLVTITLAGPSAVWFGVGFNASAMKGAPWTIIVEGDGKVSERKLQGELGSGLGLGLG